MGRRVVLATFRGKCASTQSHLLPAKPPRPPVVRYLQLRQPLGGSWPSRPGPQPAKAVREPAGRPGPRERRAAPFARDVPARPDRHLPPDAGTLTIRPPGRVAAPSQHTRPGAAAQRRRDAQKPGPRPRQAGAGLAAARRQTTRPNGCHSSVLPVGHPCKELP